MRLLFPRLGSMTLDTIERVKYFGLRNVRSCGFCRLRNGRSVTRRSRRQDPQLLNLLYGWATGEEHTRVRISQRARAREKLLRHGWKWDSRCRLLEFADACLVNIPQLPVSAFEGLIQADRMHAFYINYCSYTLDALNGCVLQDNYVHVHNAVKQCHQFRDPKSGAVHPRLHSVLKMKHLTAERRVRAIFYWAHVLGTQAEVVVPEMRQHALVAISTLQLLLISTRGHRAYSKQELDIIYLEVGQQFFMSLEKLAGFVEDGRVTRARIHHEQRPNSTRPPVPFKRGRVHDSDSSDTCETDEEFSWGGKGIFEYSPKGLPHALLHCTELMMRGGHSTAFCSFLAEVSHKTNIKLAARFSRTYASINVSQHHMLQWNCRQILWLEVIKLMNNNVIANREREHAYVAQSVMNYDGSDDMSEPPLPQHEPETICMRKTPKRPLADLMPDPGRLDHQV